jgi:hypothetical protein
VEGDDTPPPRRFLTIRSAGAAHIAKTEVAEGITPAGRGVMSEGPYRNQHRLPRLPIPTLEETCRRYLCWVKPCVTADQFAETEAAVAGKGPCVHTHRVWRA